MPNRGREVEWRNSGNAPVVVTLQGGLVFEVLINSPFAWIASTHTGAGGMTAEDHECERRVLNPAINAL
jgi:hypothetical protein